MKTKANPKQSYFNAQASTQDTSELSDGQLAAVHGGKRKPDGTAAGNVAAKWNVAQGAAA